MSLCRSGRTGLSGEGSPDSLLEDEHAESRWLGVPWILHSPPFPPLPVSSNGLPVGLRGTLGLSPALGYLHSAAQNLPLQLTATAPFLCLRSMLGFGLDLSFFNELIYL